MEHFQVANPIESICLNKIAYYSVHHLSYMFSLLAGKKFEITSSKVLFVQRSQERETYEIVFDLPVSVESEAFREETVAVAVFERRKATINHWAIDTWDETINLRGEYV